MPSFLKYGSTGRPPGKFHIRHSPKRITENLEFSHPPFDILFIEISNNNNNNIICYDNGGGIICSVLMDSKAGAGAAGADADIDVHINDAVALMNQIESNRYKYYNNNNNKSSSPSEITNNNNNNYIDNGGSGTDGTDSDTNDIATNVVGHRSNRIAAASEWFANRFESNRCNYKYKLNIDGISTTTIAPATPATATSNYKTSAEGISNEGHRSNRIAAASEWFANRFESNRCNYKYKFNIDGISTTTTTIAPATPATATSNYKTSAEGISNEGHRSNRIAAASERFANRFESNRCNYKFKFNINGTSTTTTTSTNNDDATSHLSLIFKLLSLLLIITKSFSSNTKEPKEKHHHQQQQEHYHAKDRHQFHLEQQQKHQHFKQEQHNMERMVTSIVLKLSLVAWDMWAFRNVF